MGNLRNIRMDKGLTYQAMADILKISKSFYWQLENNSRKLSYEMAVKIASVFKTTPDSIFYDEYKLKVK